MVAINAHAINLRIKILVERAKREIELGAMQATEKNTLYAIANELSAIKRQAESRKSGFVAAQSIISKRIPQHLRFSQMQSMQARVDNMTALEDMVLWAQQTIINALKKRIQKTKRGGDDEPAIKAVNSLLSEIEKTGKLVIKSLEKIPASQLRTEQLIKAREEITSLQGAPGPTALSIFTLVIVLLRLSSFLLGNRKVKKF